MLDQGESYLCEASCFFFHDIIYFSLDRERARAPPFVMLDPGNSYLREASCFFFHSIIYFSPDRERETFLS